MFFVMSLRLSDHKVLHNIASSSSFFRFRSDFLAFFARISYLKFLEFKEFNKTIIPFALVGYETGYSELGAIYLFISIFRVKFEVEFTRQAVNFSIESVDKQSLHLTAVICEGKKENM